MQFLEQKHRKTRLTEAERQEMNKFIKQIEHIHTQRILAIGALAQLRGIFHLPFPKKQHFYNLSSLYQ